MIAGRRQRSAAKAICCAVLAAREATTRVVDHDKTPFALFRFRVLLLLSAPNQVAQSVAVPNDDNTSTGINNPGGTPKA
jgi:hypothetical protein